MANNYNENIFPPEKWKPSHVTGVKELIEEGTKFREQIEKNSQKTLKENCGGCKQIRAEVLAKNNCISALQNENKELLTKIKELELELSTTLIDIATSTAPLDVVEKLHLDNAKLKKYVENILVLHVEGREFMTSSQLHEAVIQDCRKALNQ